MKKNVGLWIDHIKAVVVSLIGTEEDIKLISSDIETKRRQTGIKEPADDVAQRVLTGHLNAYYEEVVTCLRDAESIFIFGPGEAKGELEKHLKKARLGKSVVDVEPADKMTEPQIVAKVKEHFLYQRDARDLSFEAEVLAKEATTK